MRTSSMLLLLTLTLLGFSGCTKTTGAGDTGTEDSRAQEQSAAFPDEAGGDETRESAAFDDGAPGSATPDSDIEVIVVDQTELAAAGGWRAALSSEDDNLREVALLSLTSRWQPEAASAVVQACLDESPRIRVAARRALLRHHDAAAARELVSELAAQDDVPGDALLLVARLEHAPAAATLDMLASKAIDPSLSIEVRVAAIEALARHGSAAAVPPLVELLSDLDPPVAEGAHRALTALTFTSVVESWGDWWFEHGDRQRGDWAAARISVEVLSQLGSSAERDRLISGMAVDDHATSALRRDVLNAVEFLGDPAGGEALRAAYRGCADAGGRVAAAALTPGALNRRGGREPLVGLLLDAIGDESEEVRLTGFRAATRASAAETVPACLEALEDENEEIRYQAVIMLRAFSGEEHGYDHAAPPESARRGFAADVWRAWWESWEKEHGQGR